MKSTIQCKCSFCEKPLERIVAEFKRSKTQTFFCNTVCRTSYKKNKITCTCVNCGENVERTPSAIIGNVFCTRSCAAKYNNSISMGSKRKKSKKCKICSELILSDRTYCKQCYSEKHCLENRTLEESINKTSVYSARYIGIRRNARSVYLKSGLPQKCKYCGYDKHFEVCHVKDIASFPLNALIKEINSLENLVALCPNHHWELDQNIISKEDLK